MFRKIIVVLSYVIAIGYIASILMPAYYCYSHGCRGPGELDAFMPAFLFTPLGAIGTVFALTHGIREIRERPSSSWIYWPLVIIFGAVLLGVIALVGAVIYHTAVRR